MISEKGNSLAETRRKNRVLIKNLIFRKKNALRPEMAKELGLTLPTITTSVNEMIEEGILETIKCPDNASSKGSGRKAQPVAFRSDAFYSIGIELGPYRTRAVLINPRGENIECVTEDPAQESYRRMLDQAVELVNHLKKHVDTPSKLIGIGLGVPGFLDTGRGEILSNFRKDWNEKPVVKDLSDATGIPVCLDNNVRFRATGYEMMQKDKSLQMFAYMFISRGIACPVFAGNSLLTGGNTGAGELGQTILLSEAETEGRTYTVDDLASEQAVFRICREELEKGKLPALQKRLDAGDHLNMRIVLELQEQGDEEINRIMDRVIRYQGIALANVVNLLNPRTVVVDAFLMSYEKNRNALRSYAKKYFYGLNDQDINIVFHDYDSYDGARGAALGTIQKFFLDV